MIEFKETTEENNSTLVSNVLDLFFGEPVRDYENHYQYLNRKGVLKESLSANMTSPLKNDEE